MMTPGQSPGKILRLDDLNGGRKSRKGTSMYAMDERFGRIKDRKSAKTETMGMIISFLAMMIMFSSTQGSD